MGTPQAHTHTHARTRAQIVNKRKGLNLKEMRRGPTVFFQGLWPMVLFAKRMLLQKWNRTLGSAWMLLGVCWFASFVCSGVLTVGISIGTHTQHCYMIHVKTQGFSMKEKIPFCCHRNFNLIFCIYTHVFTLIYVFCIYVCICLFIYRMLFLLLFSVESALAKRGSNCGCSRGHVDHVANRCVRI